MSDFNHSIALTIYEFTKKSIYFLGIVPKFPLLWIKKDILLLDWIQ